MSGLIFRPNTDDEAFWHATYTNDEYRVPQFQPNDVVIDLGCNIGAFTKKAHDRGSRNIHAFEACPDNYEIAKHNIGGLEGVTLHHRAVVGAGNPDTLPFPVGNNSFYISEHETQDVQTTTLDAILNYFGNVRYLKIDIEGSEWEVFYSTPKDKLTNIAEINGEYHQPSTTYWGLTQNPRYPGYDYLTLQQYLQDLGFFTRFTKPTAPPMSGAFHAVKL